MVIVNFFSNCIATISCVPYILPMERIGINKASIFIVTIAGVNVSPKNTKTTSLLTKQSPIVAGIEISKIQLIALLTMFDSFSVSPVSNITLSLGKRIAPMDVITTATIRVSLIEFV